MVKKLKIVIVSNNLETGGIQKALVNLLNEIKNQYDITLFLISDHGNYQNNIPDTVNIIKANSYLKLLGISQREARKLGIFYYILRVMLVLWTKLFNNSLPIRFLLLTEKKLDKYDIAISYVHSSPNKEFCGGCNEFVLKKIDAIRKCAYIHCDFLKYGGNTKRNKKIYKQFNRIVTVSDGCKKQFIESIPELENKTYTARNLHKYEEIIQKANTSPIQYDSNKFNIVTVARLSEEKGIIRTIHAIHNLIKIGYDISWHLIGEGNQRKEIEKIIEDSGLVGKIILHGNQKNPYKFMLNADIFLLPSYHEAAPMVFDEAMCIGLPVLTTRTTSAIEMVEKRNAGWVCENSLEGIKEKLSYILENRKELSSIKNNLKRQNINNEIAIEQFNNVLIGD